MSTIKTTYIQHPSAETPAIELDATDGVVFSAASFDADAIASGVLDAARVPDLAASKITSGVFDVARIPDVANAGIGSNVVQTVKTNVFSTASSTFTAVTGLSASITPSSASSRVLVIAQLATSMSGGNYIFGRFRITGGNAGNYIGDASGSDPRVSLMTYSDGFEYGYDNTLESQTIVYLDSPATTAATTYQVEASVSSGSVYVNRNTSRTIHRGASSLTLIEVAA